MYLDAFTCVLLGPIGFVASQKTSLSPIGLGGGSGLGGGTRGGEGGS